MLSIAEKVDVLKQVLFFHGMTPAQLEVVANACQEHHFASDTTIITQGETNETLHLIVSGRVGVEQAKNHNRAARIATLVPHDYFGETSLFDTVAHPTSVLALEDTTTLGLRRDVLAEMARREPELALELIQALGRQLGEAQSRIAELSRTRPREIHKLFDQLD
jgi:CRP/FNR family transcriptional regulator